MISQFWNLCKACPALDVDKLHSEYGSTYRWHELKQRPGEVIHQISQPLQTDDSTRKKSSNEPLVISKQPKSDLIVTQSSKGKTVASTRISMNSLDKIGVDSKSSQRTNSDGLCKLNYISSSNLAKDEEMSNCTPSIHWNLRESSSHYMRESMSLGQINPLEENNSTGVPVSYTGTIGGGVDGETPSKNRQYHSEYRQCFRPFSQYDYVDGKFVSNSALEAKCLESGHPGEPWYQEVVELRKRAKDYKYRGWGTDITPSHEDRNAIYEEAAKRESLSALSLALITPSSKLIKRDSLNEGSKPIKTKSSSGRTSRPRTAPLVRGSGKSSRSESAHPSFESAKHPKSKIQSESSNSCRSKSVGPSTNSSRPPSAPLSWKANKENTTKRQRPNSRPREDILTSRAIAELGRRPSSRSSSRPSSAIEIDYFREPVVKSPPEPTRVKSPELMVRSPDPINWTVPLETTKTFSVTQSIRDGDSLRQSPNNNSDSSNTYDSVCGTSVHLGYVRNSGTNKVSSLAKEASEPTPGFIKDSTMTRPSGTSALPAKPLEVLEYERDFVNGTNPSSSPAEVSSMKCLENAPCFTFEDTPKKKNCIYKILEDPFVETETLSEKRLLGTEALLEGAREKFDKFFPENDK